MTRTIICLDVEATKLHGDGFAVGATLLQDGLLKQHFFAMVEPPLEDMNPWVIDNVWARLKHLPPTHVTYAAMRTAFWTWWRACIAEHPDAITCAHAGFPVETNFLQACVGDGPARRGQAPYPLHEVDTLLLAAGMTGKEVVDHPFAHPEHHPVRDSHESALRAHDALQRLQRSAAPKSDPDAEFSPDWASPPGDTLVEALKAAGHGAEWLCEVMNQDNDFGLGCEGVNGLLTGETPIDSAIAAALQAENIGTAAFWLERERQYQVALKRLGLERPKDKVQA